MKLKSGSSQTLPLSASESATTEKLLSHDHKELDMILAELDQAFDGMNTERSFELLDLFWGRLAVHIRAENVFLFPALMKAAERTQDSTSTKDTVTGQEIHKLLTQLREDHNFFMIELTTAIKKIRILRQENRSEGLEEIRNGIAPVLRRLEAHNALEESRVYRQAELLMDHSEQSMLDQSIQTDLENLPLRLRDPSFAIRAQSKNRK